MRIIHPRPKLGRQRALGVEFRDGVATVESLHPERERALLQHGYTIEPDLEVEVPYHGGLGEAIVDLTALNRRELREIAEMEQITVTSKMTRDQLIKAISEAPAEQIPGAVQNEDGSWTIEGTPVEDGAEYPFATVEYADGTVVGDGTSIVTLHDDGTATTED